VIKFCVFIKALLKGKAFIVLSPRSRIRPRPRKKPRPRHRQWFSIFSHSLHRRLQKDLDQDKENRLDQDLDQDQYQGSDLDE
jgi:hypothetical protein